MPQAFFYYQQKVDPSAYLAPEVAAPDLSWVQSTGKAVPRVPVLRSTEANPSFYLSPPIDLSWLQTTGKSIARIVTARTSAQANPASWLSPPIDLSWLQSTAMTAALRTRLTASFMVDASWFPAIFVPPLDVTWLPEANGPVYRLAVPFVGSRSDPSIFLALAGSQVVTDDGQTQLPWTDDGTVAMMVTETGVAHL